MILDREHLLGAERDALLKCLVDNDLLCEACVGKCFSTYEFTARGRLAVVVACKIASPCDIFFDTSFNAGKELVLNIARLLAKVSLDMACAE